MLKAAFVFLAPNANPDLHRSTIETEAVELITVGVSSYDAAEAEVENLIQDGVKAIELCGGFGHEGTARISKIIGSRAALGVVRFDSHPGLDNKSGDALF